MYKIIIRTGISVFLLYLLWLFFFKGLNYVSPAYDRFLNHFYDLIRYNIVHTTSWFVQLSTGVKSTPVYDTIYFDGVGPFIITIECLAIKLLCVFAIFIIAFPGARWIYKLWYIPAGILIIHFVNIIRMIVLSYTIIYTDYFNFMHSFVFRVIIYLTIIGLWLIWLRYFVDMKKLTNMVQATEKQENIQIKK